MTTEEKEVYSAYEEINKAMIEKDRAAMKRYFDEKLTFTHMSVENTYKKRDGIWIRVE